VVYDLQLDRNFERFTGSNTGTLGHLFQRTGNSGGAFDVTGSGTAPQRSIAIVGRAGTSQGLRIRLADIGVRANHEYKFDIAGTVVDGGNFRLRLEGDPQRVAAEGTPTALSLTTTAAQIQADITARSGAAYWSIGNTGSSTANMIITGLVITRICPDGCTACTIHGITIVNGGNGSAFSPSSPIAGTEVTVSAGTRSGFVFGGWQVTAGGVTLANASRGTTTFTMGSAAVTLTATWNEAGDSGICPSLTAHEVVANMGMGWNLGNTLDAGNGGSYADPFNARNYGALDGAGLEGLWIGGSQFVAAERLITNVRAAGFDTIRIPVTWYKAIEGSSNTRHQGNFTIRRDWMQRVRQVVDWAYGAGFYVILNSHHDEFIQPFRASDNMATTNATIARLWTLIATEFNDDFGERLIFEVLNEPRHKGSPTEWQAGGRRGDATALAYRQRLNTMNQAAVTAIRATGGNNANRILMIPTYAASAHSESWGDAFDGFARPTDPNNPDVNKFILSVHSYVPGGFTGVTATGENWTRAQITAMMNPVQAAATRLGMPVVLGEFGAVARHNDHRNAAETTRADWAQAYVEEARSRGMVPVWWDTGTRGNVNVVEGRFGLFNRRDRTCDNTGVAAHSVAYPNIVNAIMRGAGRTTMLPTSAELPRIAATNSWSLESAFGLAALAA
jgi:endoglucanase